MLKIVSLISSESGIESYLFHWYVSSRLNSLFTTDSFQSKDKIFKIVNVDINFGILILLIYYFLPYFKKYALITRI